MGQYARRQRLLMLFLWGPVGLVLFGVLGVLVVRDEWGLTDGRVLAGAAAGVALMVPLAAIVAARWDRRLTSSEVREAQTAFAQRDDRSRWPAWALYAILALSIGVGVLMGTAFGAALIFTVMTLTTILAWFIALGRRGMYQDTGASRSQSVKQAG
jgi:uncharacterized membrane protein YhaH (DUF805 family)